MNETSRPLRVAVLGAGQIGRHHIRVVGECPRTTLTAVVDPNPVAERLAYAARADWLRSLDELLTRPPELAIVAVPTREHLAATMPLIEANVAVLVEKPIAHTVDDARALIDAAARRGVVLAVGHVERFNPAVRALREKLARGVLGRVFQVDARRLGPFPIRTGDTGVALELATHDLDLMCELAGRPLRVTAETDRKPGRRYEDLLAATLRFDSGIIGLLEVNWMTPAKVRRLSVTGERGMFVVDYLNQHLTLHENPQASEAWEPIAIFEGVTEGNTTRYAVAPEEPLRAQLEAFVAAVREEAPVVATGEHGLRAVRLALAALEAGATGRTVVLEDDAGDLRLAL